MRKKIILLASNCKRCGKELLTASQSIHGLDKEKKEFGVVCSSCTTQEESASLIHSMGKAIQTKLIQGYPNHR